MYMLSLAPTLSARGRVRTRLFAASLPREFDRERDDRPLGGFLTDAFRRV